MIHADESCLGNQFQERANPGAAFGIQGSKGFTELCTKATHKDDRHEDDCWKLAIPLPRPRN